VRIKPNKFTFTIHNKTYIEIIPNIHSPYILSVELRYNEFENLMGLPLFGLYQKLYTVKNEENPAKKAKLLEEQVRDQIAGALYDSGVALSAARTIVYFFVSVVFSCH
jgi:hypothetical protein